jgi:thioredoxin reductase
MKHDAIIIGGSYAGLSAAMALGRSLRNVLLIDAGEPANRQTPHAHNLLTHDGRPPADIAAEARAQVLAYPTVALLTDRATTAHQTDVGFAITTESGAMHEGRKLVLATGVPDQLPNVPGLAACWGISVLHCPYCHGYEVAGQAIGILANGDMVVEMTRLIQQWSKHLTLFTNGPATLDAAQREQIERLDVPIVEATLTEVVHEAGYVRHLLTPGGNTYPLDALFVRPTVAHANPLAEQLGGTINAMKLIEVNAFGQTNVPGLYAVGDCSSPLRAISAAIASGGIAGAFLNRELIEEGLGMG